MKPDKLAYCSFVALDQTITSIGKPLWQAMVLTIYQFVSGCPESLPGHMM